jgi:Phosphoribosyl transferase domain
MSYRFSSLKPILDILARHPELSVDAISTHLKRSTAIIHRYLIALVADGKVEKIGSAPHTMYRLTHAAWVTVEPSRQTSPDISPLSYSDERILSDIFVKYSPTGKRYQWSTGWTLWCSERGLDPIEKWWKYKEIYTHLLSLEDSCGLLRATDAYATALGTRWLDELYYADQYRWMEFGRGRLAEVAFYAKQSQHLPLIEETLALTIPKILCLIRWGGFDAIAITPWSIERRHQLLMAIQDALSICGLPLVHIVKYYEHGIRIPQKSLKTREERIDNARNTIYVDDKRSSLYKKVLLIDDFVGSGATMNELAKKLKDEWVREVIGCALVGNLNLSYDVIAEM